MIVKAYALIPARGGSKGIPRKNLHPLGGKTLLARAIETALRAGIPCWVSTEDDEIAQAAWASGASVMGQPTASDTSTSEQAIAYAIGKWSTTEDPPTHVAMVQCTAPFMEALDITRCVEAASDGVHDAAFAACRWHGHVWTPQRLPSGVRQPRQVSETHYLEAGSVYVTEIEAFKRTGSRFGSRPALVEVPADRVFEIDEPWQLEWARRIVG